MRVSNIVALLSGEERIVVESIEIDIGGLRSVHVCIFHPFHFETQRVSGSGGRVVASKGGAMGKPSTLHPMLLVFWLKFDRSSKAKLDRMLELLDCRAPLIHNGSPAVG